MRAPIIEIGWLSTRLQDHASLTIAEVQAVQSLSHAIRGVEPGQCLLREGDRPRQCSFLLTGVSRHKIVGDGGRQIVAIHTAARC